MTDAAKLAKLRKNETLTFNLIKTIKKFIPVLLAQKDQQSLAIFGQVCI